MGKIVKNIILVLIGFLLIVGIFSAFSTDNKIQHVSISNIRDLVDQEKVDTLTVSDDTVTAKLKNSDVQEQANFDRGQNLVTFLKDSGVDSSKISKVNIDYTSASLAANLASAILPFLVPFILISLFIYFLMRQVQGTNNRALSFGQSAVRLSDERKNRVKFVDVAGEANVPFFHISGSEFVEMFVGVGAARVRDLFKKAKRNAPCIIFIDEIDAVGRQRGAGLGGGHDEREQTLNQILVEMDGFETDTNVIVMAATNRPDVLDPALLRPGRFDRQVVLDLPDIKDREEILKVHAKNKPLAADVNLRKIAERTPGFSGADLANLINEAAIMTARLDKKEIGNEELRESIEKVMLGPQRKSHILSPKEKEITAYHEGGHALVGSVLPYSDPVHKVSIISRGRAAGYTMKLPVEDKHLHTRQSFLDEIAALLAGNAAEKLIFHEITTGASNDIKVATNMARRLVMSYGMSELGPIAFGEHHDMVFLGREISEQRNYSEEVARRIDDEVSKIMKHGFETATEILKKYRAYLDTIAQRLVKEETLEQEPFNEIVKDLIPPEKKKEPEFGNLPVEEGAG